MKTLVSKGKIEPTVHVTRRVIFDEVIKEFESWLKPSNGVIKAMIELN